METEKLKLQIIQHILQTEDPVLLASILARLEQNLPSSTSGLEAFSFLSGQPEEAQQLDEDARDLQQSIDDIFKT